MNLQQDQKAHDALRTLHTAEQELYRAALAFTPKTLFWQTPQEALKTASGKYIQALLDYSKIGRN
jgi:hypothetical protein